MPEFDVAYEAARSLRRIRPLIIRRVRESCSSRFGVERWVETIEARLFTEDEIPWDELAFRTVRETLLRFFADRKAGAFGLHCVDIE